MSKLDPTSKQPVRLSIAYNLWVDDWAEPFIHRLQVAKQEYVDISDMGTARMSKRMAENFLAFLKNAIVSGTIPLQPHEQSYDKRGGTALVGYATGDMYNSLSAFRTNIGGEKKHRGWLVGIKEKEMSIRGFPEWYKLSWLEFGTKYQKPRPIVARAFEAYVGTEQIRRTVEQMISRGFAKTEAQAASYSKG